MTNFKWEAKANRKHFGENLFRQFMILVLSISLNVTKSFLPIEEKEEWKRCWEMFQQPEGWGCGVWNQRPVGIIRHLLLFNHFVFWLKWHLKAGWAAGGGGEGEKTVGVIFNKLYYLRIVVYLVIKYAVFLSLCACIECRWQGVGTRSNPPITGWG